MGLGKLQWGPLKSFSIIDCIFHMQYSRIILLQHSTVQDKVQYSTVYIYSMFQIYSTIQYPEWKPRNPFQFNLGIVGDENGCCLQRTKIALQFWPKHASLAWIFHASQDHLLHSPFFYLVHFGLPFSAIAGTMRSAFRNLCLAPCFDTTSVSPSKKEGS